jgi:hypothetical protein
MATIINHFIPCILFFLFHPFSPFPTFPHFYRAHPPTRISTSVLSHGAKHCVVGPYSNGHFIHAGPSRLEIVHLHGQNWFDQPESTSRRVEAGTGQHSFCKSTVLSYTKLLSKLEPILIPGFPLWEENNRQQATFPHLLLNHLCHTVLGIL